MNSELILGSNGGKTKTGTATAPSGTTPVRMSISLDFEPDIFVWIGGSSKIGNTWCNPNTTNIGTYATVWWNSMTANSAGNPTNQTVWDGSTITVDAESTLQYDWYAVKFA